MTATVTEGSRKGWAHVLAGLREKFLHLELDGRMAVAVTLLASVLGLVFAICAPHLPLSRRIGRVGVDLFILGGVIAFVNTGEPPAKRKGAWSLLRRTCLGLASLAALGLTLWIPDIDPWLRAYRFCLGCVLLAMSIWDVNRILPRKYLKKHFLIGLTFGLIELVTVLYVTATVDGPIAYASMKVGVDHIIDQLTGVGLPGPAPRGQNVDQNFLVYRNGRYHAGVSMLDFLHYVHGDPMGAGKDLGIIVTANTSRLYAAVTSHDNQDYCRMIKRIDAPLDGYIRAQDATIAIEFAAQCAVTLNNSAWKRVIIHKASIALTKIDAAGAAQSRNWNCETRARKWYERQDLNLTLAMYEPNYTETKKPATWAPLCTEAMRRRQARATLHSPATPATI